MSTKRRISAAVLAITLAATSAQAGGFAEALMEPEIIVAETAATTAGGIWVPLILLVLIAALASGGGGGVTPVPVPPCCPA